MYSPTVDLLTDAINDNPNLQHYYQFQVALKPLNDIQQLYLEIHCLKLV